MRFTQLTISNFRGLEHLEVKFDRQCNVIVGPNAIGKTTILEAIRLLKSVLCPRYSQEPQQVLQSLGALSQHFQFLGQTGFDFSNLARDVTKPLTISGDVIFSREEIELLERSVGPLSISVLRTQLGQSDDPAGNLQLTQFLSSPDGQARLTRSSEDVRKAISALDDTKAMPLSLALISNLGGIRGNNVHLQQFIAFIERDLNPDVAKVVYLPADRSLPQGEITIQLGSQNAQAEVQSHLAQAHTRYSRLKSTIAQDVVAGSTSQKHLEDDFRDIFDALLPGKDFKGIEVNQLGIMKVLVQDRPTGKTFDIDSMSSGEKGLILTFLYVKRAVAKGGILLLDEPESHLNSSVTRKILKYLVDCCKAKSVQAFVCTHSPEIVADAFGSDDCRLLHLRSGTNLSPIFRNDTAELFEVFERLGSSAAEVLFSSGSVFVEGVHDADILREGFDDVVSGYAINQLGGRAEVEKAARDLKKVALKSPLSKPQLFIIDNDGRPTTEKSDGMVRVLQWERRCLENYLLEDSPIYDVVREYASNKPASRGAFDAFIKSAAMKQATLIAARIVYDELEPENPGLIPRELKDKDIREIAETLSGKIERIRASLENFNRDQWCTAFIRNAQSKREELLADWDRHWKVKADGKKIVDAIFEEYTPQVDKANFKRKVIRAMKMADGPVYNELAAQIRSSLS